jgi:hypothetical protein
MANGVYYTELGIVLNLTKPDLGHPEYPGLWETLRSDKRPVPERGLQCLQCREARPDCPEWMYLSERDGIRFATHFNSAIADHPSSESDQHKAYKERIATAADRGGYNVEVEDRAADGKRRTDVLVTGDDGRAIGWEVQLSYVSLDAVRKRSGRARQDGITPLWATIDSTREFIDKVPWALMPDMPWQRIKNGNELIIRGGVRTLEFHRCDHTSVVPCPVRGRGRCGQLHGSWETALKVRIDDLVCGSAAGEYVPIIIPGQRVRRWWVRPADRDRYADSIGHLTTEDDLIRKPKQPAGLVVTEPSPVDDECRYGQDSGFRSPPAVVRDDGTPVITESTFVNLPEPPPRPKLRPRQCGAVVSRESRLVCGAPATLYPCGWRCPQHRPR